MHKKLLFALSFLALIVMAVVIMAVQPVQEPKAVRPNADRFSRVTYVVGQPDIDWSETTRASAATAQQNAWLGRGYPETIEGQVIDLSCYFQLGKTSKEHAPCGAQCVRNGQPIAILTLTNQVYMVIPEEHDARRDGRADLREMFATHMGRNVRISGLVQNTPHGKAIFVSSAHLQKVRD